MEQVKKAHKKVVKKAKLTIHEAIGRWMVSVNNDLTGTVIELGDLRTSVGRMRVAIWGLFIFSVAMAVSFLLVLYGNQYLVTSNTTFFGYSITSDPSTWMCR